jgi:hypothetical protein
MILSRLGAGAMGVVYAAYDPELDRKVALKLLHPRSGASVDARARLMREAKALARLSHPNVVAVHDVGTYADRVFLAMEFVDGKTLGAWLKEQVRPWRDVVAIMREAGEAWPPPTTPASSTATSSPTTSSSPTTAASASSTSASPAPPATHRGGGRPRRRRRRSTTAPAATPSSTAAAL